MGSFQKPKKKPNGTVTQILIDDVLEISKEIKKKIEPKEEVKESSFPTFEDYMKVKEDDSRKVKIQIYKKTK